MKKIADFTISESLLIGCAVAFANMKDVTDWAHVCRTFRVLPPGAPYWIEPARRCLSSAAPQAGFLGWSCASTTKIRSVLDAVIAGRNPTPFRLSGKEIRAASPSMYWFRVQGFGPHRKGKAKKVHFIRRGPRADSAYTRRTRCRRQRVSAQQSDTLLKSARNATSTSCGGTSKIGEDAAC